MNHEINEFLKDKFFIIYEDRIAVLEQGNEADATAFVQRLDKNYPEEGIRTLVQLQVKGTLPEGAIMPKYKVGDRVLSGKDNQYTVQKHVVTCVLERADRSYRIRVDESELSPAPPADPMRDEFEKAWASQEQADGNKKEAAYLGFKLAKTGAK